MRETLGVIGILFILAGVIFGITQIDPLSKKHDDVAYWKDAALENYDNNLIEDRYNTIDSSYKTQFIFTIAGVLSGIISGIMFLSLAYIVDMLQRVLRNNSNKEHSNKISSVGASPING